MRTAEEIEVEAGGIPWVAIEAVLGAHFGDRVVTGVFAMRDELRERDAEFDREVARRVKHLLQDRAEWGGFADNEAAEKLAIFANPTERWAFVEQSAWERIAATRTPDADAS